MTTRRRPSLPSDLRGAARLAVDATAGLTDLVEAMHQRIASAPGVSAAASDGRTRGITGLVYKSIRGVTRVVGGSVDALLGLIEPMLAPGAPAGPPSPQREALVAALNGVLGDHLAHSGNPLATVMSLRVQGQPLALDAAALKARLPHAGGRVLVLVHGLCMNDLQWLREGHDHGAALARDLGVTPVYLHYNSGLPVAANGLALAELLEQLVPVWPQPVQQLILLGHSMGGLVSRSAVQQGRAAGHGWPARLSDMVFLGTPHHGAPLERAGHWVDVILGAAPYAAPLARLARVRSAGITDLRHGHLLAADGRHDGKRDGKGVATPPHVPLPPEVRCYAVAGSIGQAEGDLKDRLLGDGLVPLDSALGRHKRASRTLAFAPDRQWLGLGLNHMALLSSPEVYAQLKRWLGPGTT